SGRGPERCPGPFPSPHFGKLLADGRASPTGRQREGLASRPAAGRTRTSTPMGGSAPLAGGRVQQSERLSGSASCSGNLPSSALARSEPVEVRGGHHAQQQDASGAQPQGQRGQAQR